MSGNTVQAIQEAGVVGAGGAGFPTHVKLSSKAECVIINGAECEPLLRVDQQLMKDRAKDLHQGLTHIMDAVGASRGVIALKAKYSEAIKELMATKGDSRVEIFQMGDFYPAGDEQVMVQEVTGRSVPEAGIPLQVNCIVNNVETVLNVADALAGLPVVDTWLTVTGKVSKPFTAKVPIGTSIRYVLAMAGVQENPGLAVIEGGPMMGKLIPDWDTPVTKTTKGLIVLPVEHALIRMRQANIDIFLRKARSLCMQCARCSELCPRNLLGHRIKPHRTMRSMAYARNDMAAVKSALLCSECGACEYACPMDLSPRQINKRIKAELGKAGIKYQGDGSDPKAANNKDDRKIPVKRLIIRLGLKDYDQPAPVQEIPLTNKVKINLRQHVGIPCQPLVQEGDLVQRGQVIGEIPAGKLGARVHASIDGIVREQKNDSILIEATE
ncbi:4Fe-4S dicluster domain-containing protein [Desulfotomaculum sp. 1211_IL3151]|uniref:4Fe-4S dicluster domain-containing protein n=1 Tax=Desulfotomaculum sp. 1211_IL3151 TaxID=3084055 RepID=UPI002FDAA38F